MSKYTLICIGCILLMLLDLKCTQMEIRDDIIKILDCQIDQIKRETRHYENFHTFKKKAAKELEGGE